jgi:hypothetical protein
MVVSVFQTPVITPSVTETPWSVAVNGTAAGMPAVPVDMPVSTIAVVVLVWTRNSMEFFRLATAEISSEKVALRV